MFPEPTVPARDNVTSSRPIFLYQYTTLLASQVVRSLHASTSLTPFEAVTVVSSEAENNSSFRTPFQTLSDTILTQDRLRHGLNETKIKLLDL